CSCTKLASIDDYFAYARLPGIRTAGGMASLYQCAASYGGRALALSRAQSNDRRVLAKRFRVLAVRNSSVARRIRRLDFGAQGCSERHLFHAYARRLCALCTQAIRWPLSDGGFVPCSGADVETHARDAAFCASAPGLLAARAN